MQSCLRPGAGMRSSGRGKRLSMMFMTQGVLMPRGVMGRVRRGAMAGVGCRGLVPLLPRQHEVRLVLTLCVTGRWLHAAGLRCSCLLVTGTPKVRKFALEAAVMHRHRCLC